MKRFFAGLFMFLVLAVVAGVGAEGATIKQMGEEVTATAISGAGSVTSYIGTNTGNVYSLTLTGTTTLLGNVGGKVLAMDLSLKQSQLHITVAGGKVVTLAVTPPAAWCIYKAGGPITSAGGDATEVITISDVMATTDVSFVEHQTTNDTDTILAQVAGAQKITITASADPSTAHAYSYAVLRKGCVGEFDIIAAGTHTTTGGNASEDITISGVLATDIAFATYGATDDSDTIAGVAAAAGKITVTMSADPSTTHSLHYVVLRPRGNAAPTHYIAYAGLHTTVGGAAAEPITLTGALATDIPIVHWGGTNDTDTIKKAVMTANTLTVTLSADPSTAHKLAYMVLRAY